MENPEAAINEEQKRYLEPHGRLSSLISRTGFGLSGLLTRSLFRLEVQGTENLPEGPCVIAPNHLSYLDAPALAAALPGKQLRET